MSTNLKVLSCAVTLAGALILIVGAGNSAHAQQPVCSTGRSFDQKGNLSRVATTTCTYPDGRVTTSSTVLNANKTVYGPRGQAYYPNGSYGIPLDSPNLPGGQTPANPPGGGRQVIVNNPNYNPGYTTGNQGGESGCNACSAAGVHIQTSSNKPGSFSATPHLGVGYQWNCPTCTTTTSRVQVSDARLKRDIVPLARLDNGIGLYRFRYRGSDPTIYVGVMAQEVAEIVPSAVVHGPDGYLRVDYDRLGLEFMTWDEWMKRQRATLALSE